MSILLTLTCEINCCLFYLQWQFKNVKMFRKLREIIKTMVMLVAILICMPASISTTSSELKLIDEYIRLNEAEKRLLEYKDDIEALRLKLAQVDIINASRKKNRADPVKLDILASRVANKIAVEAAQNDYTGHWNLIGEKPYHRWGAAGGHDHVTENAYGEWTTAKYEISSKTIAAMMKNGHDAFMKERAPNDGHKKTTINKYHNFVGLGFALTENRFRYYEKFVDRYIEFKNVPSNVKTDEEFRINVKPMNGEFLYFLMVYRDRPLVPMSPDQIRRRASYPDFGDEEALRIPAWELAKFRTENGYSIPLKFSKEGIYYIQMFLDKKEITNPMTISTKGKDPASGIIIFATN